MALFNEKKEKSRKEEKNKKMEEVGKNILSDVLKNPVALNREMTFYYSHDEHLEKTSQNVKDLSSGMVKRYPVFGGFIRLRNVTAARSNIVLLILIMVLCVFISIITKITSDRGTYKLGGNGIEVSALIYQENTFVVIKKVCKDGAYTGPVDVAISHDITKKSTEMEATGKIFTERIYFMPEASEDFRISVPMKITDIVLLLQNENENLAIQVKAD
jgi:hypothetical protein